MSVCLCVTRISLSIHLLTFVCWDVCECVMLVHSWIMYIFIHTHTHTHTHTLALTLALTLVEHVNVLAMAKVHRCLSHCQLSVLHWSTKSTTRSTVMFNLSVAITLHFTHSTPRVYLEWHIFLLSLFFAFLKNWKSHKWCCKFKHLYSTCEIVNYTPMRSLVRANSTSDD